MSNEKIDLLKEKIDFLKFNLSQLESRISLIDNKASILVAIQVGFLGLFSWLMKTVFLDVFPDNSLLDTSVKVIALGIFATSIAVIILLLQTIQPAKKVFGYGVGSSKNLPDDYLMWFTKEETKEKYFANVDKLNESKILENLKWSNHIHVELLRKKYRAYRRAFQIMKILVVVIAAIGTIYLGSTLIFE